MVSVKSSFTTSQVTVQAPSYHAIVSKHLQKQFLHSCICTLMVCYVVSFALGRHHNFTALFPWSWTGPRSLAVFLAVLPIKLVRKANLEVEQSRRTLWLQAIYKKFFGRRALRTIIAYVFSAHVLTTIYLRNQSEQRAMSLLITHHSYELPRVNERWIYVHFFSVYVALVASLVHVWTEVDVLNIRPLATEKTVLHDLQATLKPTLQSVVTYSLALAMSTPLFYLCVRSPLVRGTTACARLVYILPKAASAVSWPANLSMLASVFSLSCAHLSLWFFLNHFFTIYLSRGPMRKGRLLSEKSPQPNETLINGLSLPRQCLTRVLAVEELRILGVEDRFEQRRITLFEAGNPEAVAWRKVVEACLLMVKQNIQSFKSASDGSHERQQPYKTNPAALQNDSPHKGTQIAVKVYQTNIFRAVPKQNHLEKLKSAQESIHDNQKQIEDVVRISDSTTQFIESQFSNHLSKFLQEVPGLGRLPLRLGCGTLIPSAGYLNSMVLGLSNLLKRSVCEDTYGRVHKDVVEILTKFYELHSLVQSCCDRAAAELSKAQLSTAQELVSNLEIAISSVGAMFQHFVDLPPEVSGFVSARETTAIA